MKAGTTLIFDHELADGRAERTEYLVLDTGKTHNGRALALITPMDNYEETFWTLAAPFRPL